MFKGGQTNPYDEVVAKTTDENMTSENWELIMNICDKVQEEGETGARDVVAAILKRLTHRTSNVQLYTLTLAESLTKNCTIDVHREIASRAFTQGLERLITDRNTHDRVKKRALGLIAEWTEDFEKDPTLGIMEECYENLKSKGYKFDGGSEPAPPEVDDEVRRREEEELQRVLEMSLHDKGGRAAWTQYSLASASGAGASGSSSSAAPAATSRPAQAQAQPPVYGGYVPSASPAVSAHSNPTSQTPAPTVSAYNTVSSPAPSVKSHESSTPIVTRVKALHTFEPTEAGELAFEKGDIIKVVDRNYKDWWRGQFKGRTGIFPVNYVEPLPEPTAAELAKEAEQEAAVFSQAANVDRLLTMLRQMDPAKDNLADNDEIQELYRSCMSLRPKIVKLIDKYSQKRADLVSMNETFVKARTIFDRMMEDSLARHSAAAYEQRPTYGSPYPPPDSRATNEYPPQPYGWGAPGYDQPAYPAYPPPPAGYAAPPEQYPPGHQPQQYADNGVYAQQAPYPPQSYGGPVQYGAPPNQVQPYPPTTPGPAPQHAPQPQPPAQQQYAPDPVQPMQAQVPVQSPMQQQPPPQAQQMTPAPIQPQAQISPEPQAQPQPQPQAQAQAQGQGQTQPQAQAQAQPPQAGPPYVYDPNGTYPDPNAQLWAGYYAQGGTDPTGAVYFISVPGVKEPTPSSPTVNEGTPVASTAPLNISHGGQPGGQSQPAVTPSSPTQAHAQGFYQGAQAAGAPNMSNHSLSSAQGAAPPQDQGHGQGQAWQAQYTGLPNQFANMGVNSDGQGVGAPA